MSKRAISRAGANIHTAPSSGDAPLRPGASDQKGCLAAMVLAGAFLKEDLASRLSGSLMVAGTVFQENSKEWLPAWWP
jgi:hypothetical protein